MRKHFRWFQNGKQHFQTAGTRSWTKPEELKRDLEDKLAGRKPAIDAPSDRLTIAEACERFMQAKKNAGLEAPSLQKLVDRIAMFCASSKLEYLDQVDLTHVTGWDWSQYFKTTHSVRTNQKPRAGILPLLP